MGRIKAIITDFDGTLVDTFMANFLAYHEVFKNYGYLLTKVKKKCIVYIYTLFFFTIVLINILYFFY